MAHKSKYTAGDAQTHNPVFGQRLQVKELPLITADLHTLAKIDLGAMKLSNRQLS